MYTLYSLSVDYKQHHIDAWLRYIPTYHSLIAHALAVSIGTPASSPASPHTFAKASPSTSRAQNNDCTIFRQAHPSVTATAADATATAAAAARQALLINRSAAASIYETDPRNRRGVFRRRRRGPVSAAGAGAGLELPRSAATADRATGGGKTSWMSLPTAPSERRIS